MRLLTWLFYRRRPMGAASTVPEDVKVLLTELIRLERLNMKTLQDLKNAVEIQNTKVASLTELVRGLKERAEQAGVDAALVEEIFQDVEENTAVISAAIDANTTPDATPAPAPSEDNLPDLPVEEAPAEEAPATPAEEAPAEEAPAEEVPVEEPGTIQ